MHDIFKIQNNTIKFKSDNGPVTYDLSPLTDPLWV